LLSRNPRGEREREREREEENEENLEIVFMGDNTLL
jgi:hypothetical protein